MALSALGACAAMPVAHAAESRFAVPADPTPAAVGGAASLMQVTASLALVLAVVFAAGWMVRRLRGLGRFGAGAIVVVADVAVGAKERAVLVQVGERQVLLGVAPGRVNMLHVLDEPVRIEGRRGGDLMPGPSADGSTAAGATRPDGHPDFKAILKRSLGL